MNNDDQYIKMILALPDEFFKGWEWKVGDNLIILSNKYNGEAIIIDADLKYNKESVECMSLNSEYIVFINLNSCIPIPSQEQLQEMILNYQENTTGNRFNNWKLIKEFYNFINCGILKCVPETYTARELWLQYLMHVVCNHRWNGEVWL